MKLLKDKKVLVISSEVVPYLPQTEKAVNSFTISKKINVPTNNMNGEYLISNPNHASGQTYSTLYSDRPNVEYFDAYSPPISTR